MRNRHNAGDERVVRRFAFFHTIVEKKVIWLEFYWERQVLTHYLAGFYNRETLMWVVKESYLKENRP